MLVWSYPTSIWSYPPTTLLFAAPIALLPYKAAVWTWFVIQAAMCVAVAIVATGGRLGVPRAILVAVTSPALMMSCLHGQFSALVGGLIVLSVFLAASRPGLAGFLVGCILLKPQFGLVPALAMFVGRQWRAILAAAATVLAMCGLATAIFGAGVWADFVQHTLPDQAEAMKDLETYQWAAHSVFDCLVLAGAPRALAIGVQALASLLAVAAVVVVCLRGPDPHSRAFVITLSAVLILPYVNYYEQAIPALGALALYGSRTPLSGTALAAVYFIWLSPTVDLLMSMWQLPRVAPFAGMAILIDFLLRWRVWPGEATRAGA